MHKLYELKDMICEELDAYAGKELTRDSLDVIDKLAHSGKNIAKLIKCCEEERSGSYGMPDGSYDGSMYRSYRGSYAGPMSGGANGREGSMSRGASYKRDSMGRYSREAGYSRSAEFAEELRKMGMNLPENFRGEILRMADKMESME